MNQKPGDQFLVMLGVGKLSENERNKIIGIVFRRTERLGKKQPNPKTKQEKEMLSRAFDKHEIGKWKLLPSLKACNESEVLQRDFFFAE